MQKPKLAATLLLFSMSIGMGLPLGWSSLATRLHAQTAELTTGPQARMHSILESEPEAGASFDAGGENEKGNEKGLDQFLLDCQLNRFNSTVHV